MHANQKAKDRFIQMNAGTISPAEFFAPANVDAIMAAAKPGAGPHVAPRTSDDSSARPGGGAVRA
jgi:hypothetical protein